MGEYAYFGDRKVKLGTCEDLTYITHAELRQAYEAGAVHMAPGNAEIDQYLDPANGYRFRFPFTTGRGCARHGWLPAKRWSLTRTFRNGRVISLKTFFTSSRWPRRNIRPAGKNRRMTRFR